MLVAKAGNSALPPRLKTIATKGAKSYLNAFNSEIN